VIAIMRSEWIKLRTTAVPWVLTGIALIINALLILVIFLTKPDTGPNALVSPGYTVPHTTQQLRNLVGSGFQGYLFALLLGTLIVTTEFRHKTVTTSFLVTPVRTALVAGKLLTAAVLGAVPLAIGLGQGASLRQPLGITVMGGLILSQIFTLYTTPVIYLSLDRLRLKLRSVASGLRRGRRQPGSKA